MPFLDSRLWLSAAGLAILATAALWLTPLHGDAFVIANIIGIVFATLCGLATAILAHRTNKRGYLIAGMSIAMALPSVALVLVLLVISLTDRID